MRALLPLAAALLLAAAPLADAHDVPAGFANLAAELLPAVVNVASTQAAPADGSDGDETGGDSRSMPGGTSGGPTASGPAAATGGAAAPSIDKGFEQFLHSTEGPGSPDAASGGGEMQSLGSGFIIDSSGLIVTNNHVIDGAQSMSVILSDGTALPATVVGRDTQSDIALLRVHPTHPLTAVHFGSSHSARIGDWVIAIGNPYGLGGTVTAGIVSARGRDLQEDGSSDYIQTDAAINRGNSGGPLFDMQGNVIGINTAIYSPSGGSVGIGFAIPSDEVSAVVNQLRLYGKPRRGWIGAQVQSVTPDIAALLKMPETEGAMVATVAAGSPAATAHLRPGDVVLTYDGYPVPDMKALPRLVQESEVGKVAEVDYWRDGHEVVGHLTVADQPVVPANPAVPKPQPPAPPTPASVAELGLTLSDLSPGLVAKFNIPADTHGVVVTDVAPNSLAARQGLAVGEVILQLGGAPVPHMREFLDQIAALRADRQNEILMLVQGSDETQWISLDAGWAG
ncbi:MAG TPA: Do family serine endopeptidase [Acidisoma sp.]|jgi:serine protease Do|nr:Do family serine endopeptidase [Acidisoma sp.]